MHNPPGFRPLCTVAIEVSPPIAIGATRAGDVRVVPFVSGTFEGPDLRGIVLPGGTDWQEVGADGVLEIHARYLLETDRGERIEVRSEGLRSGSSEVLAQLARGEDVPASAYYFRTSIRLRTAAERLARLNDLLGVAYGERRRSTVLLSVFELL
ncbi:MAG: DUF3237 domain-containing protein [Polyangiales bacterium]